MPDWIGDEIVSWIANGELVGADEVGGLTSRDSPQKAAKWLHF